MTETNYTLPPRKWYTLEQAAKRINKLTGEEIEIADLFHYANSGFFSIAIHIDFDIEKWLDIQGLNVKKLYKDLSFISIRGIGSRPERLYYTTKNSHVELFKDEEPFTIKVEDMKFKIKTNCKKIKGFFILDFIDYHNNFFDDLEPIINSGDVVFRFPFNEIGRYDFHISIDALDKELKRCLFLGKECFYILAEELNNLLKGGSQINSVSFKDMLLEIGRIKEDERNAKPTNKGGRPRSPHTEKIIMLGRDIFENNSDVNLESIANAIIDYFNDQNIVLSIQLVRRVLKKNNIGVKGGKSRKIKNLP